MKKTYMAIALGFLLGVIALTLVVNHSEPAFAAPATPATSVPLVVSGEADALLLTCMDHRLIDDVADYMQSPTKRNMKEDYDYIVLAGASLGVNNTTYPAWGSTFWDHLATAIKLHQIKKVIIIDHRDSGAYRLLLGAANPILLKEAKTDEDKAALRTAETDLHKQQLDTLKKAINQKYADLGVETLLMSLDGTVEKVGDAKVEAKPAESH